MKYNIFQRCAGIFFILLICFETVQADSIKTLKAFDTNNSALFIDNDWNPNNHNTYWLSQSIGQVLSADTLNLDFSGSHIVGKFIRSADSWETVSIKSHANDLPILKETKEIQLAIKPQYANTPEYISVLLRLTMQDGSIWDQVKSFVNGRWQKGVFSTKMNKFIRPNWSTSGIFDLEKVIAWEIILVDIPEGEHSIKLHSLLMKGDYQKPPNATADRFDVNFPEDEKTILFLKNDWNPHDGDTQWLYHKNIPSSRGTYYDKMPIGTLVAYRFNGDPNETVSIKKEATTHFDLSNNNRIVVDIDAPSYLTDEFLSDTGLVVMSLTMANGSIWQKGVTSTVTVSNSKHIDYLFSIDDEGAGWTQAHWGEEGGFDRSNIKSWELVLHNLRLGVNVIGFNHVKALTIDTALENNVDLKVDDWNPKDGDMTWLSSHNSLGDGLSARFSSGGDPWDAVSVASNSSIPIPQAGYRLDLTTSYANPIKDAMVFELQMNDGSLWQKSFELPHAGRYLHDILTVCYSRQTWRCSGDPSLGWTLVSWGTIPLFPTFDQQRITGWKMILNTPPMGEHDIKLKLFSPYFFRY